MAKLGRLLQQFDEHRLPVHITPVARHMFEAIAEALPDPVGTVIRQFLDPAMTDQVLNLLGNNGQFFDTCFTTWLLRLSSTAARNST